MRRAFLLVLVLLAFLPLSLYGCGGGGGGGGTTAGTAGPLGEIPITVTGNVNNSGDAAGAPDRLEAPLAGYNVRAVNATTGETLPGAITTSDSNGNFVLSFRINITADTSIILVASDATGANVMRSILPLVATDVQTLVNQGKTTLTVGIISPSSEQLVKNVELALGVTAGALGKTAVTRTVADINTEASRDNRFVLVGVTLTISGQVTDTGGGVTPPPPALTINVGSKQQQVGFGNVVNLNAIVTNAPAGAQSTFTWTQTAGPAVALSATDVANPSFTTLNTTDAMAYLQTKAVGNQAPTRFGIRAISYGDTTNLTYTFKVTVTAGDRSGSATVSASPFESSTGLANVGAGTVVMLQGLDQASYNWSITGFTPYNGADTSTANLKFADTKYPYLIPDKAGSYALAESVSGKSLTVYAGTWWGVGVNNANCNVCHGESGFAKELAPKFVEWAETPHAKKLTSHIDGVRGGYYSASCIACHTVGYNAASQAVNDGFDDKWNNPPTGTPWLFPTTLKAGNWDAMVASYPELAGRANIQCENCHGPSGSPAHGMGTASRVSMNSEVCAPCHGAATGSHNRVQLWKESNHGSYALTARAVNNNHCGRCHSGQGFVAWLEQAKAGKPGVIIDPNTNKDATAAYLTSIGMGADTVVPQTCQTCHDPHSEANPAQLRVYNDTPILQAGFQALGVGKGAICMSCHNTRNGVTRVKNADGTIVQDNAWLHEDSDPVGAVMTSYTAPHAPSQTDIFMGHNAYFVSGTNISKHAAIEDTCVTCHMSLVPAYVNATTGAASGTNHRFSITPEQVCSKCHGDGVTGAPLQAQVEALLEKVGETNSEYLMAKMQRVAKDSNNAIWINIKAYPIVDPATEAIFDYLTPETDIDLANIDHIFPIEPHGQQGFVFVFKTPVTFTYTGVNGVPDGTTKTVTEAEVRLGDVKQYADPNNHASAKSAIIPLTDPLVKAGWNYFLFHGDGTRGIHNPSFYLKTLDATNAAMETALAGLPAIQ